MTDADDPSLEDRLDLEATEMGNREGDGDSSTANAVSTSDRVWAWFVLVAHVRVLLVVTPGIATDPMAAWIPVASLFGAAVVAEGLLRRFGAAVVGPLWEGTIGALLVLVITVVVDVWLGLSLSETVSGVLFLVLSVAITAPDSNGSDRRTSRRTDRLRNWSPL